MDKPVFSIAYSAIRSQLYRGFYDSLAADTTVPFEIVFVGPNPPLQRMPHNFKYITTNVKPAQCVEIAVRNAVGEYLILLSDDLSLSSNFLNRLYNYTQRLDTNKILISFRYKLRGQMRDDWLSANMKDPAAPFLGLCPAFKRSVWRSIGGIDKRFVAQMADVDVQMRFYERGMHPFITPDCIINETGVTNDTLYRKSGRHGTQLFHSLWSGSGYPRRRVSEVQSFSNENILGKSQGERTCFGKIGKFKWN